MNKMEAAYNQWCKDTKRNGSITTRESLQEFFQYVTELQSTKPDSVEGYLEAEIFTIHLDGDDVQMVMKDDALAALQTLSDDKDAEVIDKVVETIYSHYKKTGGYTRTAAMLIEKLTGKKWERDKEIDDLAAEVERLKGESSIQKLRGMLIEMMHKNPHITPYDIVKMIDKISTPNPPKQ